MPHEEFPPQPAPARYVPTLTEVVVDIGQPAAGAPAAPAVSAGVTAEQVLALLGPELDRRISEAIAQALHEQMLGLHARVRRAVADVVQDAVDMALRDRGHGPMSG
ncbi:MAG: hypothetical protein J0I00_04025 [Burkholderiales bacterium]|nr:hypothetical protein [Burkholderiales bacterium]